MEITRLGLMAVTALAVVGLRKFYLDMMLLTESSKDRGRRCSPKDVPHFLTRLVLCMGNVWNAKFRLSIVFVICMSLVLAMSSLVVFYGIKEASRDHIPFVFYGVLIAFGYLFMARLAQTVYFSKYPSSFVLRQSDLSFKPLIYSLVTLALAGGFVLLCLQIQ